MNHAANHRFKTFTNKVGHDKDAIVNYFQLDNSKLSITLEKDSTNTYSILTVVYMVKSSMTLLADLPLELSKYIFEFYSHDPVQLTYRIDFPEVYPFEPPVWSLKTVKSSTTTAMSLQNYYQDIVELHNNQYRRDITLGNPESAWQNLRWIKSN